MKNFLCMIPVLFLWLGFWCLDQLTNSVLDEYKIESEEDLQGE